MQPLLYGALTPWYHLLDPVADHAEAAAAYATMLARAGAPAGGTLLELGAGAGGNASFMKRDFRCTLTDIAPEMQALSRALNPECEHLSGDMRTLRLGRSFDAVLVHDAVCYMTTRADLAAAAATAFAHTRPGGVALFAPDYVRETFRDGADLHAGDDGTRALRCLEWAWDPDPGDDTYTVDYSFLLRERNDVKAVHDRHVEGLFARAVWSDILTAAGYRVDVVDRPFDDVVTDAIFVCRRPA